MENTQSADSVVQKYNLLIYYFPMLNYYSYFKEMRDLDEHSNYLRTP
jgi:hypothetical protein